MNELQEQYRKIHARAVDLYKDNWIAEASRFVDANWDLIKEYYTVVHGTEMSQKKLKDKSHDEGLDLLTHYL